jgi:hypothetical protein
MADEGERGTGMITSYDLEGVDEFSFDVGTALSYLSQDIHEAVVAAGEDAVIAMQQRHPYQDRTQFLTGGMYCRPFGRNTRLRAEAAVLFQAPYAKFVNDGTAKSKPYPFIPTGERAADISLRKRCLNALGTFCRKAGE